jgi:hypothetical protein
MIRSVLCIARRCTRTIIELAGVHHDRRYCAVTINDCGRLSFLWRAHVGDTHYFAHIVRSAVQLATEAGAGPASGPALKRLVRSGLRPLRPRHR